MNMQVQLCPKHNKPMQLRTGPTGQFWSCAEFMGVGVAGANKKGYCDGKPWSHAVAQAPQAAQASPVATQVPVASPRLEAASVALQSACTLHSGTGASAAQVMITAAMFYHQFLKIAFVADVPLPGETADADLPF